MNEKRLKKRLDFQQKIITRQSKQIDDLKLENENLKKQLTEKDELINSVEPMRKELAENISGIKKKEKEVNKLIQELRKMKSIFNREVYKNRWWLVKLLLK